MKRTRQFYADGLGFGVDWEHRFEPSFPVFAQLTRTRNGTIILSAPHSLSRALFGLRPLHQPFAADRVDLPHHRRT